MAVSEWKMSCKGSFLNYGWRRKPCPCADVLFMCCLHKYQTLWLICGYQRELYCSIATNLICCGDCIYPHFRQSPHLLQQANLGCVIWGLSYTSTWDNRLHCWRSGSPRYDMCELRSTEQEEYGVQRSTYASPASYFRMYNAQTHDKSSTNGSGRHNELEESKRRNCCYAVRQEQ